VFGKTSDAPPEREDAASVLRDVADGRIHPSALVFADSSALRVLSGPNRPDALAERAPFILSLSPYLDEVAAIADLILPTDVPLERWHAVLPATAMGPEIVPVAAPAVKRRLDTQDTGGVLCSLATAIGGATAEACTWKTSEDLIRAEVKRLAGARRGTPYVSSYETEWMQQLESGGWWAQAADSGAAFSERVLAAGGWVDPYFDAGQLSETLRSGHGLNFPLPDALSATAGHRDGGAKAEPPDAKFPIALVAFQPSVSATAGNANLPALFELLGQPESVPWSLWVEIGSEIAERLDIHERTRVRLTSAHDSLDVVAVRVNGMPAGVAALSIVPGARTDGRWSKLLGKDPRLLWGTDPAAHSCAVRITRA
jgi:anaerobic selenocysteine-containing dehydrogenase